MYRHQDGRRVVVAYHRLGDTFAVGTLKGMIDDIGWSDADLRRLGLAR
jgi:predicted RNA binding protein YcfA (HicA-like mRNA interferase family)